VTAGAIKLVGVNRRIVHSGDWRKSVHAGKFLTFEILKSKIDGPTAEIRRLLDVMPASADDDKNCQQAGASKVIDSPFRCPGIRSDRYLLILICGVVSSHNATLLLLRRLAG